MPDNIRSKTAQSFLLLSLTLSPTHPVLGQSYTLADLGSSAYYYSETHGLNGLGRVVGEYEPTNSINVHGFYYDGTNIIDVGNLTGPPYAVATESMTPMTKIVGESDTARNARLPLQQGTLSDLGVLGADGLGGHSAPAINRFGDIVANPAPPPWISAPSTPCSIAPAQNRSWCRAETTAPLSPSILTLSSAIRLR
jgi:hypothetical protein